jgi:hypothetical protein
MKPLPNEAYDEIAAVLIAEAEARAKKPPK